LGLAHSSTRTRFGLCASPQYCFHIDSGLGLDANLIADAGYGEQMVSATARLYLMCADEQIDFFGTLTLEDQIDPTAGRMNPGEDSYQPQIPTYIPHY
jgi:hypothetical protein